MKRVPQLKRAPMEMLPLMDMIFLLLVVFILMIVQMRPDFGIEVELPNVAEMPQAEPQEKKEKKTITIAVTSTSELYLDDKRVPMDQLGPELKTFMGGEAAENINVILRGDEKTDYGQVIKVFDALRRLDLVNVIFDIDQEKGGENSNTNDDSK